MDIQKIISEITAKIGDNKDLIGKFTSDPAAVIKDLLGVEVDTAQIAEIVAGVTKALGDNAGELLKEGAGILDKIKGIFGK